MPIFARFQAIHTCCFARFQAILPQKYNFFQYEFLFDIKNQTRIPCSDLLWEPLKITLRTFLYLFQEDFVLLLDEHSYAMWLTLKAKDYEIKQNWRKRWKRGNLVVPFCCPPTSPLFPYCNPHKAFGSCRRRCVRRHTMAWYGRPPSAKDQNDDRIQHRIRLGVHRQPISAPQ